MPRSAQAPRLIARKTAIGIKVSLLSIMNGYTLIATIFLITQAPSNWPTAVTLSILTPVGVLNKSLTYS